MEDSSIRGIISNLIKKQGDLQIESDEGNKAIQKREDIMEALTYNQRKMEA